MAPSSSERPRSSQSPKVKGAPDYDDAVFWDVRFSTGRDVGEWLNSGDALLDAALLDLENHYHGEGVAVAPRALHLGPGVSKLGSKLREGCLSRGWAACGIVNVDFSSEAVRMGREAEADKDELQAMQWLRTDLLWWTEVAGLTSFAPFDVIVDKSTSDAIATAEARTFCRSNNDAVCPTIRELAEQNHTEIELSPVEILALHLVPLTSKGTTWFALSYSTFRFSNKEYIGRFWEEVQRVPLKAPAGKVSATAHAPEIFHWLYILRRL